MQQGLADWQKFLADKPLPILPRTKKDVQALINQAQLSITQYASPIVYDAGLSAFLFQHVNTQRQTKGKNPLTTMGNVLSHLGQSAFQKILNQRPLLESLKLSEKNTEGYLRVMGQSCHASLQATHWAQQRNVVETEEVQLATLLQNISELMLWCYGDDVMPKIEALCYVEKMPYEQAAKMVLGCGMRELGGRLAEQWNFPEMATEGLQSKQNNFTLACGVSLASELARIVSINWYGKDATQIIQRIAKYKGKAEGEIEHVLHLNAVNVNDVLIDKGYTAPAKLLFMLADDDYVDPFFRLNTTPEKTPQTLSKKPSVMSLDNRKKILDEIKARKQAAGIKRKNQNNEKELQLKNTDKNVLPSSKTKPEAPEMSKGLIAAIKEFQLMVMQGKPAHDLIEHMVKTCLLCGVQRSVFVVKLPKKDLLMARYSAQTSEDFAIREFKIPINNPHIFKILMEKSRKLFLNKTNLSKYWGTIPESVKLAIGVKSFFAMSVFVNNHAMGLMYADKVKGELSADEFVRFQKVCRLLSQGIVQSAHNKKK